MLDAVRMTLLNFQWRKENMLDVAWMDLHHFRRPMKQKQLLQVWERNQPMNVASN